MYVPHYDAVLHALGTSRKELNEKAQVQVPVSLLKYLLRAVVAQGEFNAAGYLAANRDVQDAANKGQVADPKAHYVNFGYFEGRRGATPPVDEAWYRKTYTDIATAIRKGEISSGQEHFLTIGAEEFRAPAATFVADVAEWKKVCTRGSE
jgi:hypothetical protein